MSFVVSSKSMPFLEFANTIPSNPILISIISFTPLDLHREISFNLIRLDAFVISGVLGPNPEQNNFRPPPEPVDSTIGDLKDAFFLPNSSATVVEKG